MEFTSLCAGYGFIPYLSRQLLYGFMRASCLFRGLCPILCGFVCKRLLAWSLISEALICGLRGRCASLEADVMTSKIFLRLAVC